MSRVILTVLQYIYTWLMNSCNNMYYSFCGLLARLVPRKSETQFRAQNAEPRWHVQQQQLLLQWLQSFP